MKFSYITTLESTNLSTYFKMLYGTYNKVVIIVMLSIVMQYNASSLYKKRKILC